LKPVRKLWLSNLKNARRTLARLIKEYHENMEADTPRFRALVYAVKALVETFRIEKELEIEARLEEVERKLFELDLK